MPNSTGAHPSDDAPTLPKLLVVGGIPRAGTKLLRQTLQSHPQIKMMPTEHQSLRFYDYPIWLHLAGIYATFLGKSNFRLPDHRHFMLHYTRYMLAHYPLQEPTTLDMIQNGLVATLARTDTLYVGDKYPDYLLHYPRYIHRPETRCIFIYRDPRAVIASILTRIRKGQWGKKSWAAKFNTIDRATAFWLMAMQCIEDIRNLDSNTLIIRYEDFVTQPALTVATIANHLALFPDDFDSSLPSPERMDKYHETLTTAEIARIEELAAAVMERHGYL